MPPTAQPIDSYALQPNEAGAMQALTVDATAAGKQFTAFNSRTTHIFFTVEAAQCRFTIDGTTPTSTLGHPLEAGDSGVWPISWARAAKFIRTGATSTLIHASPLIVSGS